MDDGPDSLALAVKMVAQAHAQGVGTMVATPHTMDGVHRSMPRDILDWCRVLGQELLKHDIPVRILPGSEIRLTHDTPALYDKGWLMTMNNAGKGILIELPPMFILEGVLHTVRRLARRGLVTVIAHPERNEAILKDPEILSRLAYEGALAQITASSLVGDFGRRIMKASERLIELDAVGFIGSDIHPGRKYSMEKAFKKVSSLAGESRAVDLFHENPAGLLLESEEGLSCAP
jgi:protein-tyrosine phosphatase